MCFAIFAFQDCSKMGGLFNDLRCFLTKIAPVALYTPPRGPKTASKGPQDAPKMPSGGPQESSKRLPRRLLGPCCGLLGPSSGLLGGLCGHSTSKTVPSDHKPAKDLHCELSDLHDSPHMTPIWLRCTAWQIVSKWISK